MAINTNLNLIVFREFLVMCVNFSYLLWLIVTDGPITREKVFLTCKSNRNNYVL